jgi:uncharacterized membrane protein YeiH
VLLELLGAGAFAVSGAMVAVRARMDWLGVVVLGIVTAIGGGTLRDMMLGQTPVTWVRAPSPLLAALLTSVVVIVVASRHPQSRPDSWRVVQVADALGLAVFTATGTLAALAVGIPPVMAAVMGVVTGTGGGVIRDVLARQRPLLLLGEIYALASAAGASALVLLEVADAPGELARWTCITLVLAVRLLAIRWHWSLPRFAVEADRSPR